MNCTLRYFHSLICVHQEKYFLEQDVINLSNDEVFCIEACRICITNYFVFNVLKFLHSIYNPYCINIVNRFIEYP